MGDVYLAEDPSLNNRKVAIKIPRFEGSAEQREHLRLRFLKEAAAASQVPHHAHVCPVYDYSEQDGRPFLVMAYVSGGSLADRLKQIGRFEDVSQAVEIVRQTAEGLAALHAAGVVHRDLKPGNILLDAEDKALVTDFGLARIEGGEHLTRLGDLLGTPAYMPPEEAQAGATAATSAGDVYALGAVLFHLITGRPPYDGNPLYVLRQLMDAPPPSASSLRPELDLALEGVLRQTMSRKIAERPTALALATTLEGWLRGATDLSTTLVKPARPSDFSSSKNGRPYLKRL